jgi:hypothetical protein
MTDHQPQPQGDAAMPVVAYLSVLIAGLKAGVKELDFGPMGHEMWSDTPLVRQSDAQAAIAVRDAEIERLRSALRFYAPPDVLIEEGCATPAAPEAAQPATPPHAQEWLSDLLFSAAHCGSSAHHTMRVREMLGPERKELAEAVIQRANNQQAKYEAALCAQPADTEAQVHAIGKLVVGAQQDAYHAGMAHDGSINAQSAAFQKALQIESAIRRLVGGK